MKWFFFFSVAGVDGDVAISAITKVSNSFNDLFNEEEVEEEEEEGGGVVGNEDIFLSSFEDEEDEDEAAIADFIPLLWPLPAFPSIA